MEATRVLCNMLI